jgi:hypothetical protein
MDVAETKKFDEADIAKLQPSKSQYSLQISTFSPFFFFPCSQPLPALKLMQLRPKNKRGLLSPSAEIFRFQALTFPALQGCSFDIEISIHKNEGVSLSKTICLYVCS